MMMFLNTNGRQGISSFNLNFEFADEQIKLLQTYGNQITAIYYSEKNNILAGIIITTQNQLGFLKLPQENYYLDTVPMDYPILNILVINIFVTPKEIRIEKKRVDALKRERMP